MLSIDGILFHVISTFLPDSHSYPPGLERNHGIHIHPPPLGAETPSPIATEVEQRRTFAIISHPDAGKTTLTRAARGRSLSPTTVVELIRRRPALGQQNEEIFGNSDS